MEEINVFLSEEADISIDGVLRNIQVIGFDKHICNSTFGGLVGDYSPELKVVKIDNIFKSCSVFNKKSYYLLLDDKYVIYIDYTNLIDLLLSSGNKKNIITSDLKFKNKLLIVNEDDNEESEENQVLKKVIPGNIYKTQAGSPFLYLGKREVPNIPNRGYGAPKMESVSWMDLHMLVYLKEEDLLYSDEDDIFTKTRNYRKFEDISFNKSMPAKSTFVRSVNLEKKLNLIKEEAIFHAKQQLLKSIESGNVTYFHPSRKYLMCANIDEKGKNVFDLNDIINIS